MSDDAGAALRLKYALYQATTTFGFFWPVFTIFLLDRGLSFTEIGLLGSLSAALVVLGEVPTGYVGDRIGRRNGLVVGSALLSLSVLGFVVARSFAAFAVLWILWALGTTFRSGSADAWLYDALAERGAADRYTRVRGRGGSVGQWVSAATMLAAGVLYGVDPRLPFLAAGGLLASSIPVVLSMPRTDRRDGDAAGDGPEGARADDTFTVRDAYPVLRRHLARPPLRSFVLYVALFFAVVAAADEFIQPVVTRTVGLDESVLGPLYAGFTVASAVASYYADRVERLLSTRWAVVVIPGLVAVFLLVPAALPVAAVPVFFLVKSARTAMEPIASGYVNDHAESVGRATVLSAASMVYALVRLPVKPLAGLLADLTAPTVALAGLGACFLLGGALVHALESPTAGGGERSGHPAD